MKAKSTFQVDTKDTCLLCLSKYGGEEDSSKSNCSIIELSRFLKFDYAAMFNLCGKAKMEEGGLEETEMIVSLCVSCSPFVKQFSQLYKELEMIRLKINATVRDIHDALMDGEKDAEKLHEYQDRLMTRNPVDLMNATIADNLRREIIYKCSARLQTVSPTVEITKLTPKNLVNEKIIGGHSSKSVTTTPNFVEDEEPTSFLQFIMTEPDCEDQDQGGDPVMEDTTEPQPVGGVEPGNPVLIAPKRFRKQQPTTQLRTAAGRKTYQCKQCPTAKTFTQNYNLKYHVVENHLTTYFSSIRDSSMPPKQFQEAVYRFIQKHEERTGTPPSFRCTFCAKYLARRNILRYHMITMHLDKLQELLRKELKPVGGSATAPTSSTTRSRRVPSPLTRRVPSKCPTCGKVFSNKQTMERHQRLHTGVKPFQCRHCPIAYEFNTKLHCHIVRNHLGVIFQDCNTNGLSKEDFDKRVASTVQNNVKRLQRDKHFYCAFCDDMYTSSTYTMYHLITRHHQELAVELQLEGAANAGTSGGTTLQTRAGRSPRLLSTTRSRAVNSNNVNLHIVKQELIIEADN